MYLGLDYLANHLFMLSTGIAPKKLQAAFNLPEDRFAQANEGIQINLKFEAGKELWDALETPFLIVPEPPSIPYDIVKDDVLPSAKRVTFAIALWKQLPTLRVVVDRPFAGRDGGPYSISFDVELGSTPSSFQSGNNRSGKGLARWIRMFLSAVYPGAGKDDLIGKTDGPTGVPFVDKAWPGKLLRPQDFGIDELRVTTFFDPQTSKGGVESVELVFSTLQGLEEAPLPAGIPKEFLFAAASKDGVSVELHFDGSGAAAFQQIDGAILLGDEEGESLTALPLQWTSKVPTLFSGSFDAEAEDADPPFLVGEIKKTMPKLGAMLDGLEKVPIHLAELTCDFESGNFEFTGQSQGDEEAVTIGGLECTEVALTFKWRFDGKAPVPAVAVLRGFAVVGEPTFFRVAAVWAGQKWIAAIEANHSSQSWAAERSLAGLVKELPDFVKPKRLVNDSSIEPQLMQLNEQRRGTESDFDDLIGE